MVFHWILVEVLQGLWGPTGKGEFITCADGYVRLCYSILCGWIVDQPKYALQLNINNQACPRYKVDFKGLESLQENQPHVQERYIEMIEGYKENKSDTASVEYLVSMSLKTLYNTL